eukprot:8744865-Pyramimonas_sp.AAC.1
MRRRSRKAEPLQQNRGTRCPGEQRDPRRLATEEALPDSAAPPCHNTPKRWAPAIPARTHQAPSYRT